MVQYHNVKNHIAVNGRFTIKKELNIPDQFRRLFHGKKKVGPGIYNYRFPNTNYAASKLSNDFVKMFHKFVKVMWQSAEWREY